MCEQDAPSRVKRSRGQIADERAVVGIDSGRGDSGVDSGVPDHGPNAPVK